MIKLGRIKDHFFDEINNDDDGYDRYLEDLQILRHEAEHYIVSKYKKINTWTFKNYFEYYMAFFN